MLPHTTPSRPSPDPRHRRLRNARNAFLASFALLPLIAGCEAVDGSVAVDIRFAPTPPMEGENRLVVSLEDRDEDPGAPVEGATVVVTPHQPDGEMGPESTELEEEGGGLYVADPFTVPRAGEWRVEAEVTLPDGTQERAQRRITVAASPSG